MVHNLHLRIKELVRVYRLFELTLLSARETEVIRCLIEANSRETASGSGVIGNFENLSHEKSAFQGLDLAHSVPLLSCIVWVSFYWPEWFSGSGVTIMMRYHVEHPSGKGKFILVNQFKKAIFLDGRMMPDHRRPEVQGIQFTSEGKRIGSLQLVDD